LILKSVLVDVLKEFILFLEFDEENPFKVSAYKRAIKIIANGPRIDDEEEYLKWLSSQRGIGKGIASKVREFIKTGRIKELEILKEKYPLELKDLLRVSGIAIKKLKQIYNNFGIKSIGELEYLCRENRLSLLKGFGKKTQDKILESIEKIKGRLNFMLYAEGFYKFLELKSVLEEYNGVLVFPSHKLYVGDEVIDEIEVIVVIPNDAMKNRIEEIKRDSRIRLVFFKDVSSAIWYRMMVSGSKEFISFLEGILKSKNKIVVSSDDEIFSYLGFSYIPPEIRDWDMNDLLPILEGRRKIDFLKKEDIKGVFHIHTTYSDGANSIEDYVKVAIEKGYEYIGISDHSQNASYANGLTYERLIRQREEIEQLNRKYYPFKIFWGIEADILDDGSLDYGEDILSLFDFVIASIHTHLSPLVDNTSRILSAIFSDYATIIGHPQGRLLLARDSYKIDKSLLFSEAKRHGKIIEINAQPQRLDIDYKSIREFSLPSIRYVISPDAHSISDMDFVRFGIMVALKSALNKQSIINTYTASQISEIFKKAK